MTATREKADAELRERIEAIIDADDQEPTDTRRLAGRIASFTAAREASLRAERDQAVRALEGSGWTLTPGAAEWRPPLGKRPDFEQIDELRAELAATRAELAEARARAEKLAEAMETPATTPEIIEFGKAILKHLSNENSTEIGVIAWDGLVAAKRIIRARAALEAKQ